MNTNQIITLWESEKSSAQIASILGVTKRKLLREVNRLGLPSKKPTFSMTTIREALEYKQTHTVEQTATKFGVARSTINNWSREFNEQFGLKRKRRPSIRRKQREEAEWFHQVRVLSSVPRGLEIPSRGYGW